MQLDTLHRKVLADAHLLQAALDDVFPARRPHAYAGKRTRISTFIRKLNHATAPLDVHNYIIRHDKAPKNTVTFSALWIPDTDLPYRRSGADVRVEWHLHPDTHTITFTPRQWRRMRFGFWGSILHELVHRHQTGRSDQQDTRVYRPVGALESLREEQEYFGNYDEIEAHAFDGALEMMLVSPTYGYTRALDAIANYPAMVTTTLNVYTQSFASAPDHPALEAYHRKQKEWFDLMKAEQNFYLSLELEPSWAT